MRFIGTRFHFIGVLGIMRTKVGRDARMVKLSRGRRHSGSICRVGDVHCEERSFAALRMTAQLRSGASGVGLAIDRGSRLLGLLGSGCLCGLTCRRGLGAGRRSLLPRRRVCRRIRSGRRLVRRYWLRRLLLAGLLVPFASSGRIPRLLAVTRLHCLLLLPRFFSGSGLGPWGRGPVLCLRNRRACLPPRPGLA